MSIIHPGYCNLLRSVSRMEGRSKYVEKLVRGMLHALATAHRDLSLLRLGSDLMIRGIQTKLVLHLSDLLNGELRQLVGNLVGPLLLNVGLGEDDIDFLKITAGGLRVEEPGEGDTNEVDKGEEEIETPTTAAGEHRCKHDDGEVGDPVGASGSRGSHGTGTERVDLRRVDPGQRQRRKGEEADEQENTDGSTLGVLGGGINQASHGNDERKTLASETDQEQLATANPLNHEEGGNGGESVDGGEDTAQDQRQFALDFQIVLEQQGRVVDSSVAASELLEELAGATDHHALELLGLAELEEGGPAGLGTLLGVQVGLHQVVIGEHILRIDGAVVKGSQDLQRLLVVAPYNKPTRGLGEHQSTNDDGDSEDDLESDGEAPLDRRVDVGKTKIDPVGDKGTDGDDGTLEADEETTIMGARALGLPDGDSSSVHAVAETGNHTTDNELSQSPVRAESGSRNGSTENHQETTGHQKGSAADTLTKAKCENGTKETAQLVTSGDGTLENGDMGSESAHAAITGGNGTNLIVKRGELLDELVSRNETRHQTLIITEEGEAHDGSESDG